MHLFLITELTNYDIRPLRKDYEQAVALASNEDVEEAGAIVDAEASVEAGAEAGAIPVPAVSDIDVPVPTTPSGQLFDVLMPGGETVQIMGVIKSAGTK